MTIDKETPKRAVCIMLIGEKYQQMYRCVQAGFEAYADKCNAELIIIDKAPDPAFKRNILSQKLLIPSLVSDYDLVLFLDCDILISENAPDIFTTLPADKAFGAVTDPIGSAEYVETWNVGNRSAKDLVSDYFSSRNFEPSEKLSGPINGGVLLFRPRQVATLFSDYYYSDHEQGVSFIHEEAPMAYLTQSTGLFYGLDNRYNQQIIYKLAGTSAGQDVIRREKRIPKLIRRKYYKWHDCCLMPIPAYRNLVREQLRESYFVHFAGKYPFFFRIGSLTKSTTHGFSIFQLKVAQKLLIRVRQAIS